MSTRERMTWGGKSAAGLTLPVEEAAKKASAHPQTPDEGITHPAGYADPTQPADYENGDTSSWAEDVHGGPYRTSPAPANPMDDGGYKHPAAQPGAPAKNAADKEAARNFRAAVERKASLCIRIAATLLGSKIAKDAEAGDKVATDMIEAQALDFMDMADDRIASTLRRIEAATEDEEVLLRKMLAEDKGEEIEEKEEESEEEKKEAAAKKAEDGKMAEVMSMLAGIKAELDALKGAGHKAEEAPAPDADAEAETMLAEMMKEEAKKAEEPAAPAEAPETAGKSLADYLDDEMGLSMDVVDDPMGLFDAPMLDDSDDEILASLFASDQSKKAEEEEEKEEESEKVEESDEGEEKEAAKKAAAFRPQPKKAATGAKTVGTQVRTAGAQGDVSELAKLWDSAPDISKIFG